MAYLFLVSVRSMKRSARVAARGTVEEPSKKCKKRTAKKSPARAVPANKRQRKTPLAESNVSLEEPSDHDLLKLLLEKVSAQQEQHAQLADSVASLKQDVEVLNQQNDDVLPTANPSTSGISVTSGTTSGLDFSASAMQYQPCNEQSLAIEIGSALPASVKSSIVEGKFVCFSSILKNESRSHTLLSIDNQSGNINKLKSASAQSKKPLSFIEWVTAWNIFAKVLIEHHREDRNLHAKLAVHFDQVLELYKEQGKWGFYDITFRQQIENGSVKWGMIHFQTQIKSFARAGSSSAVDISKNIHEANVVCYEDIPVGYCKNFNLDGCFRSVCKYSHVCANCLKQGHGAKRCFKPVSKPFSRAPASNRSGHFGNKTGASFRREAGGGERGGKPGAKQSN